MKIRVIANRALHIKELHSDFTNVKGITFYELQNFYRRFSDDVKRTTIDWRIYELHRLGILHRNARGIYSLSETNVYIPDVSRSLKNLSGSVRKQFPYLNFCIWTTKWINEFMLHQPSRFYTILEVEKEAMESVFYALKDAGKNVYLDTSEEVLSKYILDSKEPIIITRLASEAPTLRVGNVNSVPLEKILVDLLCDEKLFGAYQGAELARIYRSAFEKYTISHAKLLRYASRRNRKQSVEKLIEVINEKQ